MLSDQEKQELKAAAASAVLREDFEQLRAFARRASQACSIDQYMDFLSSAHRLSPTPSPVPPFPIYTNVRL